MKLMLFMLTAVSVLYAGGDKFEHVSTQLTLYKKPSEVLDLNGQDRDCSICSKDLLARKKPVIEVACKDESHRFHEKCFNSWFSTKKTCPKCHAEIVTKEDEPKEAAPKGVWAFLYKWFCCKKCTCS